MKASTLVLVGALAALVPLSAAAQSPVIVVSAGDSFASGQGAPDTPWSYGEVSLGDDADGLVWDIDDRTWDFEDIDEMEAYWMSVSVVAPLNRILAAAVERARGAGPMWHFVSGISARFATHGYCTGSGSPESWSSSVPRYVVTPRDSLQVQGDRRGAMHPNELGHHQIGDALAGAMRFLVTPPPPVWCIEHDTRGHPRRVPCDNP